ncbi:MAG: cell division protein ZapA [Lachnospiraceae bacterium]|nr:cell division protein ZapA [Lachnospira sp.]MBR6696954.1 cell division protein ZapA [Lachnospiraceae bacterium]
MANKNNTEVVIDGKVYTLCGYESEEYLQKVASYINNKIAEVKQSESFRKQPLDIQEMIIRINLADDYFKVKKLADSLENDSEAKDKEAYDLKHDMIAAQIKIDSLEQEIKTLQDSITNYQKNIVRLETELQDMQK